MLAVAKLMVAALALASCVPARDRQLTPSESRYVDASSEVLTLRFTYNACKAHLTGEPKARVCEGITKLSGDKTKILALVILDNFRTPNDDREISLKGSEAVTYLTFMKMQAERYLRGDIGWNEMDYTITAKGEQLGKEIRP
jgi:hypothetical protein